MHGQAKEELVVDQFLLGMDNHELSVQVAAHGHRCTEDVLRLARSLAVVHEEEKHASRPCKPATQARFVNNGPLTLLTLNGWFRRFWLSWATIHANTGEGDVESQPKAQSGYTVQIGERLNLPPAHRPDIVDGGALPLQKGGPAVETNPLSAISAKGSGILPETVHLMGTTG